MYVVKRCTVPCQRAPAQIALTRFPYTIAELGYGWRRAEFPKVGYPQGPRPVRAVAVVARLAVRAIPARLKLLSAAELKEGCGEVFHFATATASLRRQGILVLHHLVQSGGVSPRPLTRREGTLRLNCTR